MNLRQRTTTYQILLAAGLFAALAPALMLWAKATAPIIRLPEVDSPVYGTLTAAFGLLLMLLGAVAKLTHPCDTNACPARGLWGPDGIYRYVAYPVHGGFVLACVGVSIATNSVSGLFLVTPLVALAAFALAIAQGAARHLPKRPGRIGLAPDNDAPPTPWARFAPFPLLFIPWLLLYECVVYFGPPPGAFQTFLPGEVHWPIWQWTEILYFSPYVLVTLAPLIATNNRVLRRFVVSALIGMVLVDLIFLTLPATAPFRPFEPHGFLGWMMTMDRAADRDNGTAAFPSFHVVWSFLGAAVWADRQPRLRWLWYAWAAAVALSCVFTGMHALLDIIAGFLVFLGVYNYRSLWCWVVAGCQRLAVLRPRRAAPVPVSSAEYNAYAVPVIIGLMALMGFVAGVPREHHRDVIIVAAAALGGAALWARAISKAGEHIFDYYGGVVGAGIGGLVVAVLGGSPWPMLAVAAVLGPWFQAAGRADCVVRGCCRGPECRPVMGIRYPLQASETGLEQTPPVHPTALYAILWHVVVGVVVLRLWVLNMPAPLVVGFYLILAAYGRFAEDAVQPRRPRAYRWLAAGSVAAGVVLTILATQPLGL